MDFSENPSASISVDMPGAKYVALGIPFRPFSKRRHRQVSYSHQFNVYLLLNPFLSVCYYLLLVPFRFVNNKSKDIYTIKTNIVQKVLSTVLVVSVTVFTLVATRHFFKQNLRESPDKAFQFATGLIIHLIPSCWFVTFWIQQNRFCKLFTGREKVVENFAENLNQIPNWKLFWLLKITFLITMVRSVFLNYYYVFGDSLEDFISLGTGKIQFILFMHDDYTAKKKDWEGSLLMTISGVIGGVLYVVFHFMLYLFEQLCLIGAAIVYATCENFVQTLKKVPSTTSNTNSRMTIQLRKMIQNIISNYLNLISLMNKINEAFGPAVLVFFLYSFPLFIWTVFERLGQGSIMAKFVLFYEIAPLILVAGIAAAGSGKMEQFKQWLFKMCMCGIPSKSEMESTKMNDDISTHGCGSEVLYRLTTLYQEVTTEPMGLRGSKFFTVTFNFVGTMIGIVITYGIVMLQFVMKPKKDSRQDARNSSCVLSQDEIMNAISEACFKTYHNVTD